MRTLTSLLLWVSWCKTHWRLKTLLFSMITEMLSLLKHLLFMAAKGAKIGILGHKGSTALCGIAYIALSCNCVANQFVSSIRVRRERMSRHLRIRRRHLAARTCKFQSWISSWSFAHLHQRLHPYCWSFMTFHFSSGVFGCFQHLRVLQWSFSFPDQPLFA